MGLDPEIGFMRPPRIVMAALNFFGIPFILYDLRTLARHAVAGLNESEKTYTPKSERHKTVFWARLHMGVYTATILLALALQSLLRLVLIGGPRIYGCWHMHMTGLIQHGGLAEDVVDHRLNSRTLYMNPISRWLYWNMNYHVEHHMFPMVPYHPLPRLHEVIKHDLPSPDPSICAAYVEMTRALPRQRSDPTHDHRKALPATARPYRDEFHDIEIAREGV
jgi:fatty acid desaturase